MAASMQKGQRSVLPNDDKVGDGCEQLQVHWQSLCACAARLGKSALRRASRAVHWQPFASCMARRARRQRAHEKRNRSEQGAKSIVAPSDNGGRGSDRTHGSTVGWPLCSLAIMPVPFGCRCSSALNRSSKTVLDSERTLTWIFPLPLTHFLSVEGFPS